MDRGLKRFYLTLLFSVTLSLAGVLPAQAEDDNENISPTAWWIYSGQSLNDISNTVKTKNARVIDIAVNGSNLYTVTYVADTGSYQKQWCWSIGVDANTVAQQLK